MMFHFIVYGQDIEMNFPKFSGKSYDFILFQGSGQKTIIQGVIPKDGKFVLSIPDEYNGYEGMSRWLITGTKEGGGLDLYLPGHGFSVSCLSNVPREDNIVYVNNDGNLMLNKLYKEGEEIVNRYDLMLRVVNSFNRKDKSYDVFLSEAERQKKLYATYQNALTKKGDYISDFIRIVNITRGIGTRLYEDEISKAKNIDDYIVNTMDFERLYTSGHWWSVLSSWVDIHTRVLKDSRQFSLNYNKIKRKLKELSNNFLSAGFKTQILNSLKENTENEEYLRIIGGMVEKSTS